MNSLIFPLILLKKTQFIFLIKTIFIFLGSFINNISNNIILVYISENSSNIITTISLILFYFMILSPGADGWICHFFKLKKGTFKTLISKYTDYLLYLKLFIYLFILALTGYLLKNLYHIIIIGLIFAIIIFIILILVIPDKKIKLFELYLYLKNNWRLIFLDRLLMWITLMSIIFNSLSLLNLLAWIFGNNLIDFNLLILIFSFRWFNIINSNITDIRLGIVSEDIQTKIRTWLEFKSNKFLDLGDLTNSNWHTLIFNLDIPKINTGNLNGFLIDGNEIKRVTYENLKFFPCHTNNRIHLFGAEYKVSLSSIGKRSFPNSNAKFLYLHFGNALFPYQHTYSLGENNLLYVKPYDSFISYNANKIEHENLSLYIKDKYGNFHYLDYKTRKAEMGSNLSNKLRNTRTIEVQRGQAQVKKIKDNMYIFNRLKYVKPR